MNATIETVRAIDGAFAERDRLLQIKADLLVTLQTIITGLREARDTGTSSMPRDEMIAIARAAIINANVKHCG